MGERKQVGLFFGSFDPIHIGHIAAITDVLNRNIVDEILVVPAYQNPWKPNQKDTYDARMHMVMYALWYTYKFENVHLSSVEKDIKAEYTCETLRELNKREKDVDFSIIGGTDIANDIIKWKDGQWILDNYKLITVERLGKGGDTELGINASSTKIREMISQGLNPYPYISPATYEIIKNYGLYQKV